jgi:hypothetical protein
MSLRARAVAKLGSERVRRDRNVVYYLRRGVATEELEAAVADCLLVPRRA